MTESSKYSNMAENPPPNTNNYNFQFQLLPDAVSILKQALKALCDVEFNQNGMGMIHVSLFGFVLSARNPETRVVAFLQMPAATLLSFDCSKLLQGMMANLSQLSQELEGVSCDSVIHLCLLDGSNVLSFIIEGVPICTLDLAEMNGEFDMVPGVLTCDFEADLQSEHLRQLLQLVEDEAKSTKLVTCDITDRTVFFNLQEQTIKHYYTTKRHELRGMLPGQILSTSFRCHHGESLNKALPLADWVLLRLTSYLENVLWVLHLRGHWTMVYNMEASSVIPNMASLFGMDPLLKPR